MRKFLKELFDSSGATSLTVVAAVTIVGSGTYDAITYGYIDTDVPFLMGGLYVLVMLCVWIDKKIKE
jgi:hypothetical protein